MSDTALVVMARYPEAGKTKTRLARELGGEATAELYRAFLTDLALRFARPEYALHWAYTPECADFDALVAQLAPEQVDYMTCFPQQGADFNTRLHTAFRWTHTRGYTRTIVIGSDSPHISRAIVERALAALNTTDIVLGPAEDGGYYLIAMRQPLDVFSGIPMSTSVVLRRTIELAQRQALTTHVLETLFDVDELPDLLRLADLLAANSTLAPATAMHLARTRRIHDYDTV